MSQHVPVDLVHRIEGFVSNGSFATTDEVLRAAVQALETQEEDVSAIRAGIADEQAGRMSPAHEAIERMENRNNT